MKRILKNCGVVIVIVTFLCSCVYRSMTHMNKDELEWVTNRQEGEIMYFKSQDGVIDTVRIFRISIRNSLDPINWAYFNTSNRDYIAGATIDYVLYPKKIGTVLYPKEIGTLYIRKISKDRPIVFSSSLGNGWIYHIPLNTTSLKIDGITMNDIMFFDNGKSETVNPTDPNPILSYSWSKKYGLVQYTYQDGTVFSRIFE